MFSFSFCSVLAFPHLDVSIAICLRMTPFCSVGLPAHTLASPFVLCHLPFFTLLVCAGLSSSAACLCLLWEAGWLAVSHPSSNSPPSLSLLVPQFLTDHAIHAAPPRHLRFWLDDGLCRDSTSPLSSSSFQPRNKNRNKGSRRTEALARLDEEREDEGGGQGGATIERRKRGEIASSRAACGDGAIRICVSSS